MATYKETVGTTVVNYAGNYPGAVDGELWFDSTNVDFKYQYANVTAAGSWRTGNAMNTARYLLSGAGIQTAALGFAGFSSPPDVWQTTTESYNGTSWTEVNDLTLEDMELLEQEHIHQLYVLVDKVLLDQQLEM